MKILDQRCGLWERYQGKEAAPSWTILSLCRLWEENEPKPAANLPIEELYQYQKQGHELPRVSKGLFGIDWGIERCRSKTDFHDLKEHYSKHWEQLRTIKNSN